MKNVSKYEDAINRFEILAYTFSTDSVDSIKHLQELVDRDKKKWLFFYDDGKPACGECLRLLEENINFCGDCGQRIKWDE